MIRKSLQLSLHFAYIFEVMLMKRFQDLCQDAKCPATVLPEFFATEVFRSLRDFRVSGTVDLMPRIRHVWEGRTLQDANVGRGNWRFLLEDMDKNYSLCLKPPPLSASSDVLFCGYVLRCKQRFTVRFAAKNFLKSCVTIDTIEEECNKFNAIFKR
jgi:hypothetical protein